MERTIEKGVTYLDKLCHKLYDEPKGHGFQVDGECRHCGRHLMAYYCEDRLYLIVCEKCGTLALTKSAAPQVAANLTLRKPTLTPQWVNKLRELDELCTKLHAVTGFTAERLLEMFAAGYTLEKPDYSKSMKELADLAEITPQNEPLTLKQLREMDGEPVYVPETNCWVLITKNQFVPLFTWPDGEQCSAHDWYEQVAPVYRRPPEGEA